MCSARHTRLSTNHPTNFAKSSIRLPARVPCRASSAITLQKRSLVRQIHFAPLLSCCAGSYPALVTSTSTLASEPGVQGFMYRLHVVYLVELSTGLGDQPLRFCSLVSNRGWRMAAIWLYWRRCHGYRSRTWDEVIADYAGNLDQ